MAPMIAEEEVLSLGSFNLVLFQGHSFSSPGVLAPH